MECTPAPPYHVWLSLVFAFICAPAVCTVCAPVSKCGFWPKLSLTCVHDSLSYVPKPAYQPLAHLAACLMPMLTPSQVAAAAAAANGVNGTSSSSGGGKANGLANDTSSISIMANGTSNGTTSSTANGTGDLVALNPRKKLAVKLIERQELSSNVRLFRFGLPSPQHKVRGWHKCRA